MTDPSPIAAADLIATRAMAAAAELAALFPAGRDGVQPHMAQLSAVLSVAVRQAGQAAREPGRVGPNAELWRLAEPGYLRGICEYPVRRARATATLIPVLLTWLVIGGAEAVYWLGHRDTAQADKPAFFADWLAQPLPLSPVMLSVVIVSTVGGLMWHYHRAAADQRRADRADAIAHRLEAGLVEPLAALRTTPVAADAHVHLAAGELTSAARRFGAAADRLVASVDTVDRVGAAVQQVVSALPGLGDQVDRLAEVEKRVAESAAVITEQTAPIAALMSEVDAVSRSAATTAAHSEAVLKAATTRLAEASTLTATHATHRETLAAAHRPFTDAATTVHAAARDLSAAAGILHTTANALRETVDKVDWLAMVADGLRHAGHDHAGDLLPGEEG